MSVEIDKLLEYYSAVIIKPDAIRDSLSEMIIGDLEQAGLSVVYRRELILKREVAEQLYAKHLATELGQERYPYAVESLLLEDVLGNQYPCVFLILKSKEPNALTLTQEAKGRADKSGIRAKYRIFFWYELEHMGITGDELKIRLSQNRLHIPDSYEGVKNTIKTLVNKKDISYIEENNLDLARVIKSICSFTEFSVVLAERAKRV